MEKILISIIVPTKNASKTLKNTLLSIKNQSYKNFECINIDFSDDGTSLIVKNLSKIDNRFKTIRCDRDGLAHQRNFGLKYCNGNYITFIDGDDQIDEFYLEKLLDALIKNNCDIACCGYKRVDSETNKPISTHTPFISSGCYSPEETVFKLESDSRVALTISVAKLIKKEILNHFPSNELILNEDEASTYKWLLNSSKIYLLNEPLYYYYITKNSLSFSHNNKIEEKAHSLCKTLEDRLIEYEKRKYKETYKLALLRLVDVSLSYAKIFKHKNTILYTEMISYYKKYKKNIHNFKLFLKFIKVQMFL